MFTLVSVLILDSLAFNFRVCLDLVSIHQSGFIDINLYLSLEINLGFFCLNIFYLYLDFISCATAISTRWLGLTRCQLWIRAWNRLEIIIYCHVIINYCHGIVHDNFLIKIISKPIQESIDLSLDFSFNSFKL